MEAPMMASGSIIKLMAKAFTCGLTAGHTLETGSTTIWMGKGLMCGRMGESTKANLRMIRNMGMACMNGLTSGVTKAIGSQGNSTARAATFRQTAPSNRDCGTMAADKNGSKLLLNPLQKVNKQI